MRSGGWRGVSSTGIRGASVPSPPIVGLVIAGNARFFSAGADLAEISALDGPSAYEFSKMGQALMAAVADFPAPVYAAIAGYCMGGGLDLRTSRGSFRIDHRLGGNPA